MGIDTQALLASDRKNVCHAPSHLKLRVWLIGLTEPLTK
jgi:hypothetical protein